MRQLIYFIIIIITFTSCNHEANVKYTYYDSGKVKEKFIYKSKKCYLVYLYSENGELLKEANLENDFLHGNCKTYNNGILIEDVSYIKGKKNGKMTIYQSNGKLKMKRTFLNDSLYGITQVYGKQGDVRQEYFHINGNQVMYDDFYDSDDGTLTKKVRYRIDTTNKMKPIGQLIVNKTNDVPIPDNSFFYTISNMKDTIDENEQCIVTIKFINKFDWKLEVQIGQMNKLLEFMGNPMNYSSSIKEISFPIEPQKEGLNIVFGKLIATPVKSDVSTPYSFVFYDEFYVRKGGCVSACPSFD